MKRRYLKGLVFTLIAVLLIAAAVWVWWQMPEHGRSVLWKALTSVAAILAVLAALAEFTGWNLREMWAQLRGRLPKGEYADFPFYVVHSYDDLVKRLFPEVSQPVIPDRSIRYQPRGVETTLDELFQTKGRILIRGRSKTGKTRETAELLRRHWHGGFVVLLLKPYEQFQLPFRIPDGVEIPHRNLVLLVDDIDHYCVQGDAVASVEASEPPQPESFPERFHRVVEYFEIRCGSAREVRVLMTVRREDEFWSKLNYHPDKAPWNALELFDLPDVPVESAQSFMQMVGNVEGMAIDSATAQAIAAKNEGTFLNLVWALRDWKQEGLAKIGQQQVDEFEGRLARTWELRYQRAVKAKPEARLIYAAIDVLRRFGLMPQRGLVIQIAAILDSTAISVMSDRMRLWIRRFYERLAWYLGRSALVRALGRRDRLYGAWKRFWLTRLGGLIGHSLSTLMLYELPNARRISKVVDWLTRYEIPQQNDILYPYDGQVDGRGEPWLAGERIANVLLPEGGMTPQPEFLVKLLRVARQLWISGNLEESVRLLDRIIRSGLEHAQAYEDKGWLCLNLRDYEGALAAFTRALELHPGQPRSYSGRAWAYRGLKEYEKAIADATKAITGFARPFGSYLCRAHCYAALGEYEAAIGDKDRAVAASPESSGAWIDMAWILTDLGHYGEALKALDRALELDAGSSDPHFVKVRTLLKMGDIERADAAVQEGLSKVPSSVQLLENVSRAFYEIDYFERAIEYARQALASDAKKPRIRYKLAQALLANGQTNEALAEYDTAMLISRRAHEFRRAIDDLEELAQKTPDLAGVETALAKLRAGLESLERSQEETEN